ncbi:MAG: Ankyrin repeats (3 copies) [bacterium ADurb.Bin157]|nr:ankyrin repeat domain-containing protein [Candidatus Riflebacteria bacterium]OQB49698.1 MAG: Ankyrin repeats (3 copies) [bacterium ADurb.Bin157]
MEPNSIFETYLKQIAARLTAKEFANALDLCREMKARLYASAPVNPVMLGWQRYYHFLCLVKLDKDDEALDLFLEKEPQPYILDHTQSSFMTSVSAELACARKDAVLTMKLSRLAWAMSFHTQDLILRIQKAQNACIYFERLEMNRLNFGFARFLTGFGRSNEVPVLYLQGLECLAANYRQSASLTIAAILLNSAPHVAEMLENPPDEIDKSRISELVERINRLPRVISVSGEFENALKLLEDNSLSELNDLIKKHPLLVNENTDDGETLLFKAIEQSNLSAVQMLVEADSDVHRCENNKGYSPLLTAVEIGNTEIVKVLLDIGADPEAKDNNGESSLIKAVIDERFDVVSLLLEYGVILNRRDDRGYTSLMHATAMGDVKTVKVLISAGADAALKSTAGETLLDIAQKSENEELITMYTQFLKVIDQITPKSE